MPKPCETVHSAHTASELGRQGLIRRLDIKLPKHRETLLLGRHRIAIGGYILTPAPRKMQQHRGQPRGLDSPSSSLGLYELGIDSCTAYEAGRTATLREVSRVEAKLLLILRMDHLPTHL